MVINIRLVMYMLNKSEFGRVGEQISCKYLVDNNYKILDKNFYYKGGEIDIIAFDIEKNEVVFFEVKTRSNKKYGYPYEAVNSRKIDNIRKGIKYYLFRKRWQNKYIRADILELYYKENKFYINHIKQII